MLLEADAFVPPMQARLPRKSCRMVSSSKGAANVSGVPGLKSRESDMYPLFGSPFGATSVRHCFTLFGSPFWGDPKQVDILYQFELNITYKDCFKCAVEFPHKCPSDRWPAADRSTGKRGRKADGDAAAHPGHGLLVGARGHRLAAGGRLRRDESLTRLYGLEHWWVSVPVAQNLQWRNGCSHRPDTDPSALDPSAAL